MARRFLFGIILLLTFSCLAKADNLGYSKYHPLRFGVDVDYPPMEYVDEDGIPQGLDVQFTQLLMKRLDIPFTYAPNSWENIADDLINEQVDLGMMVYSPYRKDITNFSRAVFRLYYQMLTRSGDERLYGLRNVEGKSIAFMRSRPIADTLTKAGANIHIVQDLQKAIRDLAKGKYDGVICFRYQAHYLIEVEKVKGVASQDLALTPREYCYVSHDKKLITAINAELDKLEAEGVIDDVYGNVRSQFGSTAIPVWVWYIITSLVICLLLLYAFLQWRNNKRLTREMLRAQRSEQLKNVFLGNVSHALRTPLNSIIGFSEVMMNAEDNSIPYSERKDMLRLINDSGYQLLGFIDELLQLSDIEGEEMLFNRSEVDLETTMEDLARETRSKVKPGVEVIVEGKGGCALADVKLMRLVTLHCLDNAARYTHKGRITLAYRFENNGLRIEVRDTGDGLPQKLRDNIFGLLSAEHTYMQNNLPGLGLTICKAVVERSNGRIGAESPPEGGTVVWHWVPVKRVN